MKPVIPVRLPRNAFTLDLVAADNSGEADGDE